MPPDGQSVVIAAAVVAAVFTLLAFGPVLRRLPEPLDGADKPTYRSLATPRLVSATALIVAVVVVIPGLTLGGAGQPLWWVFGVGAGWLAVIDQRTTWLPWSLVLVTGLGLALATGLSAVLGSEPGLVLRAVVGSLVAGGLFWIVWRVLKRGFGFGDVQFAFLVGAVTGADSWQLLSSSLIAGSLAGLVIAVVRLMRRRSEPFAYVPALFAGPYLACLVSRLG